MLAISLLASPPGQEAALICAVDGRLAVLGAYTAAEAERRRKALVRLNPNVFVVGLREQFVFEDDAEPAHRTSPAKHPLPPPTTPGARGTPSAAALPTPAPISSPGQKEAQLRPAALPDPAAVPAPARSAVEKVPAREAPTLPADVPFRPALRRREMPDNRVAPRLNPAGTRAPVPGSPIIEAVLSSLVSELAPVAGRVVVAEEIQDSPATSASSNPVPRQETEGDHDRPPVEEAPAVGDASAPRESSAESSPGSSQPMPSADPPSAPDVSETPQAPPAEAPDKTPPAVPLAASPAPEARSEPAQPPQTLGGAPAARPARMRECLVLIYNRLAEVDDGEPARDYGKLMPAEFAEICAEVVRGPERKKALLDMATEIARRVKVGDEAERALMRETLTDIVEAAAK